MAEPGASREPARESTVDASKAAIERPRGFGRRLAALLRGSGPLELALAGCAALAAAALVLSAFTTVIYVSVASASCDDLAGPAASQCSQSGFHRHSVAFVLLGVLVLAMATLALARHVPGPYLVILLAGVAAIAIALVNDLPASGRAGAIGLQFTDAHANKGLGLWLEAAGGALAAVVGLAGFLRRRERYQR